MPQTKVIFYKEDDGTVPVLDWLNSLPSKVQDKCVAMSMFEKYRY